MKHLVSFRLLASFLAKFSGKFDLLMFCGDIETAAHNFYKISHLKAYNAIHTYDIICLS